MKIKVLQYNLMRDGKNYPAGSVVDLPEEEAKALVESAPKEFHFAEAALPEDSSGATAPLPDLPPGVTGVTEEEMAGEKTLEDMTMAELKEVAKEAGLCDAKSTPIGSKQQSNHLIAINITKSLTTTLFTCSTYALHPKLFSFLFEKCII